MIEITFLGTSSAVPTKKRNHPAVLIRHEGDYLLFDCGEGTQRQFNIAGISPMKVKSIFITHWHGDHVLGLPGIIQSFSFEDRGKELNIFGPEKTKERFYHILKAFPFQLKFKINVIEINTEKIKEIVDTPNYKIFAVNTKHGNIHTLAYSLVEKDRRKIDLNYTKKFGLVKNRVLGKLQKGEDIVWKGKKIKAKDATIIVKGKKITYIGDSEPTDNIRKLAEDSDILISEAMFIEEYKEKAEEWSHMTAKEISQIAKKAKVKKLILTHFSRRFEDEKPILKEAIKHFKNTVIANDFVKVVLK